MKIGSLRLTAVFGTLVTAAFALGQTLLTGSGPWKEQGTPINGQWVVYAVDAADADGWVDAQMTQYYGAVDLYFRQGAPPTLTQFDLHPTTVNNAAEATLTNDTTPALLTGRIYIGIYASSKSRFLLQVGRRSITSDKTGMGATPFANGTTFRVWAPNATGVYVAGPFNNWNTGATRLLPEGNGNYSLDYRNVWPSQQYKYFVWNGANSAWKNDPHARLLTNSAGNSIIYNPSYNWTATNYSTPTWDKTVVYEMHVGSFNPANASTAGTFDQASQKLDYIKSLGVNEIELMPVNEFPGDFSWGYNPSYPYSVESAYGGPDKLKAFIDAAHSRGIGVMVDVVYNHLGPNDLDLWQFDGWSQNGYGGIYFYNDGRAVTPWGNTRPDFGRGEVRQYIHDCALMWLQEFRADGLRWDSTLNIRTTNQGDNGDGWSLMQWVNNDIAASQPWKLSIAEDMQGDNWLTLNTGSGGAGYDSQWAAQFVHPVRDALTQSSDASRSMAAVAAAISDLSNGYGLKRTVYTDSHDEDANGHQRLPSEIDTGNPGSYWARKRSTLGAILSLTSPGIPMLFQGQEFLESGWFDSNRPLDWTKVDTYSGILQLYKDLIAFRKDQQGWTNGLTGGNVNVFHVNDNAKVLAYHRYLNGGPGDDVVVVANFANTSFPVYTIGFPRAGHWNVIFNSDWTGYSPDYGNSFCPDVDTVGTPYDGFAQSGNVVLAPYSAIILVQKPGPSAKPPVRVSPIK